MTTKPQHTPGPWEHFEQVNGEWRIDTITDTGANMGIAHTVGGHHHAREANAALIAAAPELLEALEDCRAEIQRLRDERNQGWSFKVVTIDAAIAKARGEA